MQFDRPTSCTWHTRLLLIKMSTLFQPSTMSRVRIIEAFTDYSLYDREWQAFSSVWTGSNTFYNSSSMPNYGPYLNLFNWTNDMIQDNVQPIFYSGSGMCPDIVHRLTNVTDMFLITLEDQNGAYPVANAAWCDQIYHTQANCCEIHIF
jgi:hypothetical protein